MRPLARLRSRRVVPQRSAAELDAMAAAGAVVASALQAVHAAAVAGVSTLSLDQIAESVIREAGATPSFLGYHGYPASICASVNDRVVHGIPSAAEILAPGDLVSIDCGAVLDGWHGDAAITFGVGALIRPTKRCRGDQGVAGGRYRGDGPRQSADRRRACHRNGYACRRGPLRARSSESCEGYGGHGIGRQMHMDPFLPNEGAPGRGPAAGRPARCWPSNRC